MNTQVDTKEIDTKALSTIEQVNAMTITNNESFEKAGEFLKTIKGLRKETDKLFDPIIKLQHDAWKGVHAQKKLHSEPLTQAEQIIKPKITAYLQACERKRVQEQMRLEAEAKKRQEEEAVRQAELMESVGDHEGAEDVLQEAAEAPAPVAIAPKTETKVNGISQRKVWKWTLVDLSKVNKQYLMIDKTRINQQVRATGKDSGLIVGGIRVYQDTIISARSK